MCAEMQICKCARLLVVFSLEVSWKQAEITLLRLLDQLLRSVVEPEEPR